MHYVPVWCEALTICSAKSVACLKKLMKTNLRMTWLVDVLRELIVESFLTLHLMQHFDCTIQMEIHQIYLARNIVGQVFFLKKLLSI